MGKRYLNFLIIPEGSSKSIKFKLPSWKVWMILSLLCFWVVILVVLTLFYGKAVSDLITGTSLRSENERLKEYNSKVVELEKELQEYRKFTQKVAELAGIENPFSTISSKTETKLTLSEEEAGPTKEEETALSLKDGKRASERFSQEKPTSLVTPKEEKAKVHSDSTGRIPRGQPIRGWITKEFSLNELVFGGGHTGIDFAAKEGTEVKVTADGIVNFAGWDDVYGNLVAVDHGNGYVTYYGHNSKITVDSGSFVKRGQILALSGNSGKSSAPHLHYEIRKEKIAIDPKDFLNPK